MLSFDQAVHAIEIAADAETAITGKAAIAVLQRQRRQFDGKTLAIIHGPQQRDTAPGLPRGKRLREAMIGIEAVFGGDVAPLAAGYRGRLRTDQAKEVAGIDAEGVLVIKLPDEAQRRRSRRERRQRIGRRLRDDALRFGVLRFVVLRFRRSEACCDRLSLCLCRLRNGKQVFEHIVGVFLARRFGSREFFLTRRRMQGARRDQRDKADIAAAADPLQHHAAEADRRFRAAILQRVIARRIETGIGEIAEAEQGACGLAGADEQAVAREGGDRRVDAIREILKPFHQRHAAAGD